MPCVPLHVLLKVKGIISNGHVSLPVKKEVRQWCTTYLCLRVDIPFPLRYKLWVFWSGVWVWLGYGYDWGMGMTIIPVPVHKLELVLHLVTGEVAVEVCSAFPVEGTEGICFWALTWQDVKFGPMHHHLIWLPRFWYCCPLRWIKWGSVIPSLQRT